MQNKDISYWVKNHQLKMSEELYLFAEIKKGNRDAFSLLFKKYYKDLVMYAGSMLNDREKSEDIVQNVFLKLWADREQLEIISSPKSFLIKSVKNACYDVLRHKIVVSEHEKSALIYSKLDDFDTENYIFYSDLHQHLDKALEKLPPAYKEAFELNRFEGLKYREIASRLSVSERTIEVRIGKAIALLRKYLTDFLITTLIIFVM